MTEWLNWKYYLLLIKIIHYFMTIPEPLFVPSHHLDIICISGSLCRWEAPSPTRKTAVPLISSAFAMHLFAEGCLHPASVSRWRPIPCVPLLQAWCSAVAHCLPDFLPSDQLFDKTSEFQLQHDSIQWIFRLISFRTDWLDLLAVQGTQQSSPAP